MQNNFFHFLANLLTWKVCLPFWSKDTVYLFSQIIWGHVEWKNVYTIPVFMSFRFISRLYINESLLNPIKLHDYQTWTATSWKISQLSDALNKKMIYVMTFGCNRMLDSMPIFKWYVHTVWNATQGIFSIVYMICEMKTFSSLFVPGWAWLRI